MFDGFADADVGGKMASRTYEVKGTNTVILKESARLVMEEQVADALPDGRFVICDAEVIVFDSKLRGGCRGVVAWYLERVADALYIFLCATYPAQTRRQARGAYFAIFAGYWCIQNWGGDGAFLR